MVDPEAVLPEFSFWTFFKSVDWRDPWIIGLLSFHALITMATFSCRNNNNLQIVVFVILLLLVYFSENLNELAHTHWRAFSRHQYFDEKGMFLSIVFSIPILLNCMIMVAFWLYQSGQLMIQLKTAELKQQKRAKDK